MEIGWFLGLALFFAASRQEALCAENLAERSFPADPEEKVLIDNPAGAITVMGWELPEVRFGGTISAHPDSVAFEQGADSIRLSVSPPNTGSSTQADQANLVVAVPRRSVLSVTSTGANVRVDGTSGETSVSTVSGRIFVTAPVQGNGALKLSVDTVSGPVSVEGNCAEINATSVNGDLLVAGSTPVLRVQSTQGRIRIEDDGLKQAEISSITGAVEVWYRPTAGSSISISAVSGSILLHVPPDAEPEIIVSSLTGSVDASGLTSARRPVSETRSGNELHFTLGRGDSVARISSYTGSIVILDQNVPPPAAPQQQSQPQELPAVTL